MIVLDTNVIFEVMRPAPSSAVLAWLDRQRVATLYLTSLSVAELRYGVAALPAGRRRDDVSERFEDSLLPHYATRILPFDEPASPAHASMRATLRAAGQAIGEFDALIAAIARVHRFAVATRDTAPFAAAGIDVINPWDA